VREISRLTACVREISRLTACVREIGRLTACVREIGRLTAGVREIGRLTALRPIDFFSIINTLNIESKPSNTCQKFSCARKNENRFSVGF